jgi:hypothetical protein
MNLHSFDREPPPELAPALSAVAALPKAALAKLPSLLAELVGAMPEDQLDTRLVRLCRGTELDPERAAPPLKAARFLFRQAASAGAGVAELTADVERLCGDASVAQVLARAYDAVLPGLRDEIASASITAHGKVLAGVEWRLDAIAASSRGRGLQIPIALVTLRYQDRGDAGSFTVQLLPSMVKELRDACDALLGPHPPPRA